MKLVVCRTIEGWRYVASASTQATEPISVASDDPLVRAMCSSLANIKTLAYIERMESLYCVADEVKVAIQSINAWLDSHGKISGGIPGEVLYWPEHVEGGMTAQRIQDALLLIRSYLELLDSTDATEVLLIWSRNSSWENQVLSAVCRSRGIKLQQVGVQRLQRLIDAARYAVKSLLLREPLNMARALLAKVGDGKRTAPGQRDIIFQLGSSLPRHVDNIVPIMMELKEIGYRPVALCWTARVANQQIRECGAYAENLESYLGYAALLGANLRMWRTWINVKMSKASFVANAVRPYQSVPLGGLLWPSIRHSVLCELAQVYRYQWAIRRYLKLHSPLAVKLWGGDAFMEGQALIRCLEAEPRPLLMFWFRGFAQDPYEKDTGNIDLYLVAGKHQRDHLRSLGVNDDRIRIVGMSHYDSLPKFIEDHDAAESRRQLGIKEKYAVHVLFDLSLPYRGLLSPREFQTVMDFMGRFARSNPSIALIVKPHPSTGRDIVDFFGDEYSANNIYVLDGGSLPYHALNAADLLVCKCTSLGLEAMLFGKPVISIGLDNEPNFKIFGDAAEYVESLEGLEKLLVDLIHEPALRADWTKKRSERGMRYMDEYLAVEAGASARHSAIAIHECLSGWPQPAVLEIN